MKLIGKISEQRIDDEIQYLVIISDKDDTNGFFLFMHKSLDEPSEADLWFANIEEAKRQAKLNYGVELDAWQEEMNE